MATDNFRQLKEDIFSGSDDNCFIERERALCRLAKTADLTSHDCFANILSEILDSVSTPVAEYDYFVGRVVEGLPEPGMLDSIGLLCSLGHMNPDYSRLLAKGYRGILDEIKANAASINTETSAVYAKNAEIVVNAIHRYALRYSEAAARAGKTRAAEALSRVPYEPAYDLFSALQSVWLTHMIASCYVGARDYAFGYMDDYLYPYYLIEKRNCAGDGEIRDMLAQFFIKPNEICGLCTHNYKTKPILCQSSKQYVMLDGGRDNELSRVILDAARLSNMAQPQFTVLLSERSSPEFKSALFDTLAAVTDKLHIYNYELIRGFLRERGVPDDIADRPTFSACCTFDLYYHSYREEFYLPVLKIFCDTLYNNVFSTKAELLSAFGARITESCEDYLKASRNFSRSDAEKFFVLDTLLLGQCDKLCDYPPFVLETRVKNIFLPGLATLGDSLAALDRFVFDGKIMSYSDFVTMLKADFKGYDDIHAQLCALTKFGNDDDVDRYTVEAADLLVRAVDNADSLPVEVVVPAFYSLERDNSSAWEVPATPDGRLSGQPFSENQSPSYGADKSGITALLNSLSKLPFCKTCAGGLNLTFSGSVTTATLRALAETYFGNGGLHIGISVLDREQLADAMSHPEKYRTLTVRLYGFSEYFISLPEWQQIAVLNRTEY